LKGNLDGDGTKFLFITDGATHNTLGGEPQLRAGDFLHCTVAVLSLGREDDNRKSELVGEKKTLLKALADSFLTHSNQW